GLWGVLHELRVGWRTSGRHGLRNPLGVLGSSLSSNERRRGSERVLGACGGRRDLCADWPTKHVHLDANGPRLPDTSRGPCYSATATCMRVGSAFLQTLAIQVTQSAASILTGILIARSLGPDGQGRYAVFAAAVALGVVIGSV